MNSAVISPDGQNMADLRSAATGTNRNRALDRFVVLVTAAGLLALGHALTQAPSVPKPFEWLFLAGLAVACASFPLRAPGIPLHVSLSDTFVLALVALYGPAPAVVAMAIDGFVVSWRRGHSADRMLFNVANPALGMWLGGQTFVAASKALAGSTVLGLGVTPPALFAAAGVYFLASSSIIAVATGLDQGQRPFEIWRRHFTLLSLSHAASASVALFMLLLVQKVGLLAVLAVAPVLGMIFFGVQARFGRLFDAERHLAMMDRLYLSTIRAFSTAIEAKDGVTNSHIHRVQSYSLALAHAMGVKGADELKALEAAALLHDTGKLAVPEHILNKPGKLTPAEFEQMKLHVEVGADILSSIEFPYPVVPIVHAHHENWDGSGYPRGLRGEGIPLGARILSVVDCFDALTSDRPYRPAMSGDEAAAILRDRRGTMYDPAVVDAFIELLPELAHEDVAQPDLQRAVSRILEARLRDGSAPRDVDGAQPSEQRSVADSLSRLMMGSADVADLAHIAALDLARAIPGAEFAFYQVRGDGLLEAESVVGMAVPLEQLPTMAVGDRVTGWAAATGRQVVNADARLDLGTLIDAGAPRFCLATPFVQGDQIVGVLTAYALSSFSDEHARAVVRIADRLAPMFALTAQPARFQSGLERVARPTLRLATRP